MANNSLVYSITKQEMSCFMQTFTRFVILKRNNQIIQQCDSIQGDKLKNKG